MASKVGLSLWFYDRHIDRDFWAIRGEYAERTCDEVGVRIRPRLGIDHLGSPCLYCHPHIGNLGAPACTFKTASRLHSGDDCPRCLRRDGLPNADGLVSIENFAIRVLDAQHGAGLEENAAVGDRRCCSDHLQRRHTNFLTNRHCGLGAR